MEVLYRILFDIDMQSLVSVVMVAGRFHVHGQVL